MDSKQSASFLAQGGVRYGGAALSCSGPSKTTMKYKLIQIVSRLAWMLHSKRLTIEGIAILSNSPLCSGWIVDLWFASLPFPKCRRFATFIYEINPSVWEIARRKFKSTWWKTGVLTHGDDYEIKLPISKIRCRIKLCDCEFANFNSCCYGHTFMTKPPLLLHPHTSL